jgi:hypothetical protein
MSRAGVVAVTALALVCLGGLALVSTLGPRDGAAAPPRPLSVATSITPRPAFFGDPVTARAEVVVDRRLVDPDSVRFDADFEPYAVVGAPQESRSEGGRSTSIGLRFTLSCLVDACVPDRRVAQVSLPPLRVRAALRAGGTADLSAPWPSVEVTSRIAGDVLASDRPVWRIQLGLPAVSYRVSPGLVAAGLTAVSAAFALTALALAGWELARRRRLIAERGRRRSALERALELARASATLGPDDRRRALALLARVLAFDPNGGRRLAPSVEHLAWARADPSPTGLEALLDEVERTVRGG